MPVSLPHIGDVLAAKYRVDDQLGEGGMGVVYGAHHLLLDKPVAVKILAPELVGQSPIIDRFLTEARAAARLDGPHVARVMDVGTLASGLPYMVMERLDGCDLEELLRREKRLAIPDAVDYALQALEGLAQAHALGIIHRDLKPANIFLARQADGTSTIKILDFGIAKVRKKKGPSVTVDGEVVGSPKYMSPEHIRNAERVDHRTDIWAMGVVLYELLAGRPPFDADGMAEMFAEVLNTVPPAPSTIRSEIPDELDAAVMKCLAKDRGDRWPDATALARALAPFGKDGATPAEQTPMAATTRAGTVAKHRFGLGSALLAVLALVVVTVGAVNRGRIAQGWHSLVDDEAPSSTPAPSSSSSHGKLPHKAPSAHPSASASAAPKKAHP
jgi:serine/threonine protein kinase